MSEDHVKVCSGTVNFTSHHYGKWEVALKDILVVGEYTTEEGPWIEDHFLVLITNKLDEHEIPVSTKGLSEVIAHLCEMFSSSMELKLYYNTVFDSRIIFPLQYEGCPLYNFRKVRGSVLTNLLRGERLERILSNDAKNAIDLR